MNDIYCCLGTSMRAAGSREAFRKVDYDYPAETARFGAAAGAEQYLLVSSVGARRTSPNFYLRVKGETEDAVRSSGIPSVGIFRPSFLLGDRPALRASEATAIRVVSKLSFVMVGPTRRFRPIEGAVVARAMVEVGRRNTPGITMYESETIQRIGAVPTGIPV